MKRVKPRVLVIGPTPPPYNGMSVLTENLLKSNLGKQFEIILLDTADRRGLTNVGRLDWRNLWLALRHGLSFLWLLISKRPDIVYVCVAQNALAYLRDCLFLVPGRLLGRHVVVHLHGSAFRSFYLRSPALLRMLIRWTLARVYRAVVLGESLRGVFAGLVPEDRIAVVPNGVKPIPLFNVETIQSAVRPDGYHQVVYLSTLMKAKGFMEVLRSVPLVVREEPLARFVLAGEHCYPEEMREAKDFISRNQLHDFVRMPGVVVGDEKARVLNEADVFVFPPITPEGQPLVVLEAMSAGLPVITTPQGAIPETIVDGVNGFLLPAGDPAAIADKILLLLRNEDLRHRMGQASREQFLKHYTLDRWSNDMARVFQEVLEEN